MTCLLIDHTQHQLHSDDLIYSSVIYRGVVLRRHGQVGNGDSMKKSKKENSQNSTQRKTNTSSLFILHNSLANMGERETFKGNVS